MIAENFLEKKKMTYEVGTRQSYQIKNMLQNCSKLNVVILRRDFQGPEHNRYDRDFSGGPVTKTLCSQCRVLGSVLDQIPNAAS